MHKNASINCQSCIEKFLSCDPKMVFFVKKIQESFQDCHVAIGYRDQADQHLAKITGKSTFEWPDSKHNFTLYDHPYSRACDLFMLGADGRAYFRAEYFFNIWNFYKSNEKVFGPDKYIWGGNYEHLKDYDHFEVVE